MSGSERFAGRVLTGVVAVVQNGRGEVLFVKQRKGPYAGHWLLPGGGIEPGETARTAVEREVLEETGIRISDPAYLACYELMGRWEHGPYHLMMLAFTAQTLLSVPAQFQGDGVDGVEFRDVRRGGGLHPTDLQILTDAGLTVISRATINRSLAEAGIQLQRYGEPRRG